MLLDEFVLNWTGWLPSWSSLISNGLIPFAVVLLGILLLDKVIQKIFTTNHEERVLFLFIFLFTALLVLTTIGIFFRGPGMELFWPWDMPVHV